MNRFSSDTAIDSVVRQLVDRSLPKSAWTHSAHFAAALWLLRHRGSFAVNEMPPLIKSYNQATGVANTASSGYHETITLASLRAAQSWLVRDPGSALYVVLDRLLVSELGDSKWLLTYWSAPVLFSDTARKQWVEPDLQLLPYSTL